MVRGKPGWTFVVTGLALLMVSLDNLVVTMALPSIRADLGTDLEGLEWTVNAYTLAFAAGILTASTLGDRYGRRRLFVVGLAVFTAASAAAAVAPTAGVLVAARAVQGLGGAVLMPLTLTLLAGAVPGERRAVAMGAWSAMGGLGVALGPLVGGAVTQGLSWQWIFWINVPVGVVLLPLARIALAESRAAVGRVDVAGVALATTGLFGVVFALVRGNGQGWTSGQVLGSLIAGAVLLAAFVAWELRVSRTPGRTAMLPMRMFTNRGFATVTAVSLVMALGMFGAVFLLAQFMQVALGYSPLTSGVRTLPWTGMPVVVAPLAGVLVGRIGGRPVLMTGLVLQAVALALFAVTISPDMTYATMVPSMVLGGVGMGLFFAPVVQLALEFAPAALVGIASGTVSVTRETGTVLGVAVLGAIFAANGSYRSGNTFTDGVQPALWVGAAALALAAALTLLIPRARRSRAGAVPQRESVAEVSVR